MKRKNLELKKQFQKVGVPKTEILTLNDISLHPLFDYAQYTDSELLLAHTVAHNLFAIRKPQKELINISHQKIVIEMEKRHISHKKFDKLDNV